MSDYKLGRKVVTPEPEVPEWKRIKGTQFEVNAKGQKRTANPANEQANAYVPQPWPNWAGPIIGSTPPFPIIDEDNV